jgi:hypothetical protein
MRCRHTVPDWHRYVMPSGDAAPIFAGCRLLVKEGEPAGDPRSIACAFWGHQRDCPLYDGPEAPTQAQSGAAGRSHPAEVPVMVGAVWPVRAPGATDGMRFVLMGLGVLSTALLAWAAGGILSVLNGEATAAGSLRVTLAAAAVSIVTHVVATLRTWARR